MNRPLTLYQVPNHRFGTSTPLADLTVVTVHAVGHGPVEIRLDVSGEADGDWQCPWLQASISDRYTARRYYGVVEIEARQRPSSGGPRSLAWQWWLQREELEALHATRSAADGPVTFELHVNGLVTSVVGPVAVQGSQQLDISLEEWRRIERELGYAVPPSQERLLSPMNLASPAWTEGVAALANARARMVGGDTYHALQDVFDAFESVVSQPYIKANWLPLLGDLPEQKGDGVAAMLSGYCTFINKVSRHRDRSSLEVMPLDAWEAELAVAVGHFLLAYAQRARRID